MVREKCEVINQQCEYFVYQKDSNGDITIVFCNHPKNPDQFEDNCRHNLCPLIGPASKDFS